MRQLQQQRSGDTDSSSLGLRQGDASSGAKRFLFVIFVIQEQTIRCVSSALRTCGTHRCRHAVRNAVAGNRTGDLRRLRSRPLCGMLFASKVLSKLSAPHSSERPLAILHFLNAGSSVVGTSKNLSVIYACCYCCSCWCCCRRR